MGLFLVGLPKEARIKCVQISCSARRSVLDAPLGVIFSSQRTRLE